MRAHGCFVWGLLLLAACSTNIRTKAYETPPGDVDNVTIYLSNQRPGSGRAALAVYVDDRLVVRYSPDLDIHANHETKLRLSPGPHRIQVTGPNGTHASTEVVVASSPLFVSASWWSTKETEPITIEVFEGQMPGFC